MEKYIASVDLDDTFLRQDKSISDESVKYVQNFVSQGNHFFINTGRPHQSAITFLKRLGIHEPVIVNNGTAIVWYDNNYKKIEKAITFPMDRELVRQFNKEIKSFLQSALITCLNDDYTYNANACPFWVIHKSDNVAIHEGDVPSLLNHDPIKAEYWVYSQYDEDFRKILEKKEYKDHFDIIRWGTWDNITSYEISLKGINKGSAVTFLAKKCHINKKNILSFGDQLNDIPMICSANYGVAMINAVDEVKCQAHYISEYDFNNDGVIHFINKIIKE